MPYDTRLPVSSLGLNLIPLRIFFLNLHPSRCTGSGEKSTAKIQEDASAYREAMNR